MDNFAKYLQHISSELKVLEGDVAKIIISKTQEAKQTKNQDKKDVNKKVTAQEQFKKISLKSMQPVTKMYKSKEDIQRAQNNPEIDFINKRLEDIFKM